MLHNSRWKPLLNPLAFVLSAVRHRSLVRRLAVRKIRGLYVGSMLGLTWAVLQPLFMLAVFTFVFSVVLQIRWGVEVDNRGHFALILFSGLLTYNILQHALTQSPMLIVSNPSFVKKVVFPLETLSWVLLAEAIFQAVVGFAVFVVMYIVILGTPPITILLLPVVIAPLCLVALGSMWFLSSAGVYLRDLGQLMGVVATLLLFISPIFYPFEAVPDRYKFLLLANPITVIVNQVRDVAFWGHLPSWRAVAVAYAAGWLVAWAGYSWFMLTKRGFSDVV